MNTDKQTASSKTTMESNIGKIAHDLAIFNERDIQQFRFRVVAPVRRIYAKGRTVMKWFCTYVIVLGISLGASLGAFVVWLWG